MSELKKIFRNSKDDVWKKLCEEIGAEFVEGGRWKGDKIQAKIKEWTITLDTYTLSAGGTNKSYTRLRAPYINRDNFRFAIYHQTFISIIEKLFGMEDIKSGYDEFDKEFIIKSNDGEKIKSLCSNEKIRELIMKNSSIYIEVKDDEGWFSESFPDGVDELYAEIPGVLKDREKLKSLYELFSETINHLCHIGSAYENDPHLSLK